MPHTLMSYHLPSFTNYIDKGCIMKQDLKESNILSSKQVKLFIKIAYFCNGIGLYIF